MNTVLLICNAQLCIVKPPCKCTTRLYANCSNLHLTEIPKIVPSVGVWVLDLSNNDIRTIGPNATKNAMLSQVYLSNNKLEYIDDKAFIDSEMTLNEIHLDGNCLNQIPSVVTNLPALISLQVHNNPYKVLDKDILSNVSKTLISLSFGSRYMTSWPVELQQLTNLAILKGYNLHFETIPEDGFRGFVRKLGSLEIINTKFKTVPLSLNKLTKLTHLALVQNVYMTGLPEEAFKDLQEVTNMFFTDNGFTSLPAIFKDLRNIYQVAVSSPKLEDIAEAHFPTCCQRRFQYLSITNTKLKAVPDVITDLNNLTGLDLSNGRISHVKTGDFYNLSSIVSLILSGNPIKTIDSGVFSKLTRMSYLFLDGTELTKVPEAIKYSKVTTVDMNNNTIRCTCANLAWMISWNRRTETIIEGQCFNITMTIEHFKDTEIPQC